jgi:hypothetical protein
MEQERGFYLPGGKRFSSQMSRKHLLAFRVSLSVVIVDSWLLGVGCRVSVVGCRLSVIGCRVSVVRCRVSVVGCQLSVVGCWLMMACVSVDDHFFHCCAHLCSSDPGCLAASPHMVRRHTRKRRRSWFRIRFFSSLAATRIAEQQPQVQSLKGQ